MLHSNVLHQPKLDNDIKRDLWSPTTKPCAHLQCLQFPVLGGFQDLGLDIHIGLGEELLVLEHVHHGRCGHHQRGAPVPGLYGRVGPAVDQQHAHVHCSELQRLKERGLSIHVLYVQLEGELMAQFNKQCTST